MVVALDRVAYGKAPKEVRLCEEHGEVEHYWHKDGLRASGGHWRCAKCNSKNVRQYREGHRESIRESRNERSKTLDGVHFYSKRQADGWFRLYRLRPIDVLIMYLDQDGKCALCKEDLSWEDKYVDHKKGYPGCRQDKRGHELRCPPESVRGLVHSNCNTAIGLLDEDPRRLRRAIEYVGEKICP